MIDNKTEAAMERDDRISALKLNDNPSSASEVPYKEIQTDVLVIGGGYAGIFAAMKAKDKGLDVTVVDKGRVGKGGKTPWAAAYQVYDPSSGESRDEIMKSYMAASDYMVRQDFAEMWFEDSMGCYKDLESWGAIEKKGEINQGDVLRKQLRKSSVRMIEKVVITSLLETSGRVVGAVGFITEKAKAIIIKAKAVIICAGSGGFKNPGYPIGALTHDGSAMAYRVGAEISGKENIDWHETRLVNMCNPWASYGKEYEWPILPRFSARPPGDPKARPGQRPDAGPGGRPEGRPGDRPEPPRPTGDRPPMMDGVQMIYAAQRGEVPVTPQVLVGGKGCFGPNVLDEDTELVLSATAGMTMHRFDGIFTKIGTCETGVDGLFAAGDSVYAALYNVGVSSTGSTVQGARAGIEAAEYIQGTDSSEISREQISEEIKDMFEPLFRKTGYSPAWVTQYLQSIMTPYFVLYVKRKEMLEAALTNVEYLQKNILPRLKANDTHELRLVYETRNLVLNAEMKLRASLFRDESRGSHYREDFPVRDDKNWLSWAIISKDSDQMKVTNRPIPDEWKPDSNLSYEDRYKKRFPGEVEFLDRNSE